MGDHHLVVDLRSVADDRRAVSAAVDRRAGPDLHVRADNHIAQLGRETMAACHLVVPKPIGAQHHGGMNDRPGANDRILVKHRARKYGHVLADFRSSHDMYAGVDGRAGPDCHVVADRGKGMYVNVRPQQRRGADYRQRADPDPFRGSQGAKMAYDAGKCLVRVVNLDGRRALGKRMIEGRPRPMPCCRPGCGPGPRNRAS